MRQFRRHDRQACHKANITRKYYDADGKLVAANRHKAMEQKSDSLVEYRENHSEVEVSQLRVKAHFPQYKEMSRPMPGSLLANNGGKVFTLMRSDGKHNGKTDYFVDTQGIRHLAKRCILLQNNQGIIFAGIG